MISKHLIVMTARVPVMRAIGAFVKIPGASMPGVRKAAIRREVAW